MCSSDLDLIFDLEQMLPAPRIEGKVTGIRVEQNTIVQMFSDGSNPKDKTFPKFPGNYIALRGNSIQADKLTMRDCDIVVFDMEPADPLDFFLDHYKEQVAAGYTKMTNSFQVRTYMKDFGKLAQGKKPAAAAKN